VSRSECSNGRDRWFDLVEREKRGRYHGGEGKKGQHSVMEPYTGGGGGGEGKRSREKGKRRGKDATPIETHHCSATLEKKKDPLRFRQEGGEEEKVSPCRRSQPRRENIVLNSAA